MVAVKEKEVIKGLLPMVGVGTAVVVVFAVLARGFALGQRAHYQNGQYLISVRYSGQWHDIRSFVQPDNPDIIAVCSRIGPDPWALYDFVCRNIDYRRDWGEFWMTPSETLKGAGDCEDSAILLTSLIRASGDPNCYVALGSWGGYGHAWSEIDGQIFETTFTSARSVPDPQDYYPYVYFNDQKVVELWPGALGEIFSLARDEATKLDLIAEAAAC